MRRFVRASTVVAAVVVGLPAAGRAAPFRPGATVQVPGTSADGMAVGDFDADGTRDVAVVSWSGGRVYAARGRGAGALAAPVTVASVTNPNAVAAGDVNGDGADDLVVVTSSAAQVLLSNRDGTFAGGGPLYAGSTRYGVAAADLNGDGRADLLTTENSGDLVVRLNTGSGGFGVPARYPVAVNPGLVAVRDLNRDGVPDVVTTDVGNDTVVTLTGRGDGTLAPARGSRSELIDTRQPVVADFDGDGRADVAVAPGTTGGLEVHFGTGDGGLHRPSPVPLAGDPRSVGAGDFDGDGRADLVGMDIRTGVLRFLGGRGDGTFELDPAAVATGRSGPGDWSRHLLVDDVDGDGRPDVLTLTDNGVLGVLTSVPEPGAASAASVAGLGLLGRRRHRGR